MREERDRKGIVNHEEQRESGRPGDGQGRRDEVGGSGVYPASGGDAPDDAVVRTPGEWGEGAGGEEGGRSELNLSEEELRAAEQARQADRSEKSDR